MSKLISIAISLLLGCVWIGMVIATYSDFINHPKAFKSYEIAFLMMETPLLIFMAIVICSLSVWIWRLGR